LAVGEGEIAADDEVVAGAVRVAELVADGVGRQAGVAADGEAPLDVAVEDVQVAEDEGAVVVRDPQAGGRDFASLQG
jgi:hypothetical protein